MVSQYGVDSVLAAITTITSSKTLANISESASTLYLKLCQISNTLLVQYRKQIGGRMHLLIPLLQILLTCLFTLHTQSRPTTIQKPPKWLSSYNPALSATHATAYSRILLTLTHPSVSSTTSIPKSHVNSLLTDQTRKARVYAAKYVPYVLMHFCSLQLVGRMTPEIRKALLPGIWSCIEILPREALHGMNAGMGRDDRAVWSNLWAEYCRIHGQISE
jgi:nucleolar pre-ribosomal-associated protein 2